MESNIVLMLFAALISSLTLMFIGSIVWMLIKLNTLSVLVDGVLTSMDRLASELNVQNFITNGEQGGQGPLSMTGVGQIYTSADGKYQATSVPELIQKMISDPNTTLSEEEIASLKKFLENHMEEDEDEE